MPMERHFMMALRLSPSEPIAPLTWYPIVPPHYAGFGSFDSCKGTL